MKAILPLLLAAALLHAEEPSPAAPAPAAPATVPPVPQVQEPAAGGASSPSEPTAHAESAKSGSPAGGAGERSKTDGVPHAEPAETKPHAESAENAEPAAPGGAAIQHSAFSTQHSPLSATVSLTDGSSLKGALRPRFLPARSPTLGEFRIDLAKVERIDFIPTSGGNSAGLDRLGGSQAAQVQQVQSVQPVHDCRVSFTNADTLTATLSPRHDRFVLDTLLGRVRLPLRAVSSISFVPPHSAFSTQHSALLYHCTFDNPSAISSPSAGPSGRFLGGSFVAGKKGGALRVEKDAAAFEAALPKGFLGPEGCIEFWAKIEGDDPRYVDGGDPLFFSLFDERGAVTLLQFAANNGFARGGLGGAIASWPFGTVAHWSGSMPYEGVLGPDWAGWHHYAMSWKAVGFGDGSFVKVFVDGKPQPVLGGVDDDKVPARLADLPNHAFLLGAPWDRSHGVNRRSKKPFLIDEFKIWKAAKTEFAE